MRPYRESEIWGGRVPVSRRLSVTQKISTQYIHVKNLTQVFFSEYRYIPKWPSTFIGKHLKNLSVSENSDLEGSGGTGQ